MALKFPPSWRFQPPRGSQCHTETIPGEAVDDFIALIRKTTIQGDVQDFLEHFKRFFCRANGNPYYRSSSEGWAETDLLSEMSEAATNAPIFLEAFYNACEAIRDRPGDLFAPDALRINEVCRNHNIGYEIVHPNLLLRGKDLPVVQVLERPLTLDERAREIIQSSLQRSDSLLVEGRGREAVQEALWLLETVATAFRGIDTETGTIEGKYFNKIVKELRESHSGTTFNRILEWVTTLHGYLSSPTGGGVRHGLDLKEGLELSLNEAKLCYNLIRSYISFLLAEHERLSN